MNRPSGLCVIHEPEVLMTRPRPICAQEPAWPRAVERPWPRQPAWREYLRKIGL